MTNGIPTIKCHAMHSGGTLFKRFYLFAIDDTLVNLYMICIIMYHILVHLLCEMSMNEHKKVSCIQTSPKGLLYKV